MVLEIQFESVKCTTVTVGYAKVLSNILFIPIPVAQAIKMDRLDENKPLQNAFKSLSANSEKWSNTLKQFVGNLPTNCLSVFDHFMNLALKGLNVFSTAFTHSNCIVY